MVIVPDLFLGNTEQLSELFSKCWGHEVVDEGVDGGVDVAHGVGHHHGVVEKIVENRLVLCW